MGTGLNSAISMSRILTMSGLRSCISALVVLGAISAAWSAGRHAPPHERWIPIKFAHDVPNALVGWFKQILGTDYSVIYNKGFSYAAVSLRENDRFAQDLLIYIDHPNWCGSGGCTMQIWKFNGRSYTSVGDIVGVDKGEAAFAGTATNGFRDLVVNKANYLVFDGKRYVEQMPFTK
jgi:hypothetical protein